MAQGKLITFEGGEGAGKTTQIKRLAQTLKNKGHGIIITAEPGGTPAAKAMRQLFIDHKGQNWDLVAQAFFMYTTRRLHLCDVVWPALEQGKIVLCDRFADSTTVYQGYAGGLPLEKLDSIRHECMGDFEPDLTFVFDVDPKTGLRRAKGRGSAEDTFEDKALDFHEKLRQGYLDIAAKNPQRCHVINANESLDMVQKQIEDICLKTLV